MHSLLIGHLFITFFLILQATHILSMQRWIAAAFLKYFEQKWFRNEETSIKGRRESNTGRELGQGVSAGTRTSDIWQQASSSATCPWVMNTQVNEIDGGTRKHAVKQGKKWQRWVPPGKWNADDGFNSALSGVFFFFLIWPQSTSCQEISDIHSLQTHSYGTRTRLVYIPVSSIQSDCDCSVKWRMCDHCAATNTLCGRVAGLWAVAEGTDKRQQCWLIGK